MGRYGNIDGIATLTNNPIAKDNSRGTIGNRSAIGRCNHDNYGDAAPRHMEQSPAKHAGEVKAERRLQVIHTMAEV